MRFQRHLRRPQRRAATPRPPVREDLQHLVAGRTIKTLRGFRSPGWKLSLEPRPPAPARAGRTADADRSPLSASPIPHPAGPPDAPRAPPLPPGISSAPPNQSCTMRCWRHLAISLRQCARHQRCGCAPFQAGSAIQRPDAQPPPRSSGSADNHGRASARSYCRQIYTAISPRSVTIRVPG